MEEELVDILGAPINARFIFTDIARHLNDPERYPDKYIIYLNPKDKEEATRMNAITKDFELTADKYLGVCISNYDMCTLCLDVEEEPSLAFDEVDLHMVNNYLFGESI